MRPPPRRTGGGSEGDVNEGIERGQWRGEEDGPVGFRCEWARLGCDRLVELPVREYEEIRANPPRFVLLPGHEFPDTDAVIETRGPATSSSRSETRPER